jgi:hypothetical protein
VANNGPTSFGTAFATAGFSFDPNLSPNNQTFANAALAVVIRNGQLVETAIQPFLPGGGTNATAVVLSTAVFANPTNNVSGTATNGTSTLAMRSDAAPALDWAQSPTWTGNHIFNPATGVPLVVQLGNTTAFEVVGTASLAGRGPVAAALVDMTPDSGSFTATLTGVTPAPSCTAQWRRMGNLVVITIAGTQGTSNANTFTLTGLPAAIQPVATQNCPCTILDNGSNKLGAAQVSASGTITFLLGGVSGTSVAMGSTFFTASGQKGPNVTTIGPYALR